MAPATVSSPLSFPSVPAPVRKGRLGSAQPPRKLATAPKRGAGGAAPAGGTGSVPLFLKTLEGGPGGTTAQAKPIPPLKEGASHNKTIRPGYAPPPLQNPNYCAMMSP